MCYLCIKKPSFFLRRQPGVAEELCTANEAFQILAVTSRVALDGPFDFLNFSCLICKSAGLASGPPSYFAESHYCCCFRNSGSPPLGETNCSWGSSCVRRPRMMRKDRACFDQLFNACKAETAASPGPAWRPARLGGMLARKDGTKGQGTRP